MVTNSTCDSPCAGPTVAPVCCCWLWTEREQALHLLSQPSSLSLPSLCRWENPRRCLEVLC